MRRRSWNTAWNIFGKIATNKEEEDKKNNKK